MSEQTQDVKTTTASSAAETGVIEESPTSETAETQDVKADQSLADFVKEQRQDATPKDEKPQDLVADSDVAEKDAEKEKESVSENETDKAADAAKESGEKEDATPEDKHEETIPYERFQEVNERLKGAEEKARGYENIEAFCRQNRITNDQYEQAMKFLAAVNGGDYEMASKYLAEVDNNLQGLMGKRLPDDLQKDVDSGDLPLVRAQEIAKLRAQTRMGEARTKAVQADAESRRQADLQSRQADAAEQWEKAKRSTDVEYKPKAKDSDPNGKWELTRAFYKDMLYQTRQNASGETVYVNPVTDERSLVALLEKAYAEATKSIRTFKGVKPATKKVLSSNGSSSTTTSGKRLEDAKTLTEAISIGMQERGYKVR